MAELNRRFAQQSTPTDSSVKRTALTGGALTLDPTGRGLHVSTAGTITGKLLDDTADLTETYEVGWHPVAYRTITSSTAVGFIHH